VTVGTVLLAVAGGLLAIGVVTMLFRVLVRRGPHCRCGHHRSVHRGPDTGCVGMWPSGVNAIGARQWTRCTCASYRPTEVSWWHRMQIGTEEHQF
jgi:hypothetical protein